MFFILVSWLLNILINFYIIRCISNRLIRLLIVISLCILLTIQTCQNLNKFDYLSILIITICWLISIRLFDLIGLKIHSKLTIENYLFQIFWIFFPIKKKISAQNQWSIVNHIILIIFKLLINHWIYRWCLNCPSKLNGSTIILYFLSMNTISYLMDSQMIFLRIITRDKYTIESYTNFPLLSLSLGEFWGKRYNQLVNTILKQSFYKPIRNEYHSSTLSRLLTFILSGLMHVHIIYIVFDEKSLIIRTFLFFLIHGIVCCIESNISLGYSEHVRWFLTQMFLLLTAPLILKPFIIYDWKFLRYHPPPLLNLSWIPQIPIPSFCPS